MMTKLMLRRYHFDRRFKDDVSDEVKSEIWNNNHIKLVDDVKNLLLGNDKLMDKLKDDFKWELHFPEKLDNFKFENSMVKTIFNSGFLSRTLNEESSHKLILKSYINHYFNSDVIKSSHDKNKHTKYVINDKFKRIYIIIQDSLHINNSYENGDITFLDE